MINERPKTRLGMSLVEFFECGWILDAKWMSPAQRMTLKAVMGDPLDTENPIPLQHKYQKNYPIMQRLEPFENEVEMFKFFSNKDEYEQRIYSDVDLLWGRRSGKSTFIGAGIALYFATQFDYTPYLRTSPHATIPIISPSKEQAGEVYAAIKQMILRSPYLFQRFMNGQVGGFEEEYDEKDIGEGTKFTGGVIKFNNKVHIKVMAADTGRLRGLAVPMAILDENCFFGTDVSKDKKVTDIGIYEALRPAFSQFRKVKGMALLLKISSPNGQSGLMYGNFLNAKSKHVLHLQVPSWYANPDLSEDYLEEEQEKGDQYFNREFGAQYTASETSYLNPEKIEECIVRGAEVIDPQPKYKYAAAMDYATKGDYWTFAIGHKEYIDDYEDESNKNKKEIVYIDLLMHWRGTSGNELDPSSVIPIISEYLKRYRVSYCLADQYAYAPLRVLFQREGCNLKEFKITKQSKMKFMMSLAVSINSGSLRMVHNPEAVKQLKGLREKVNNGIIRVEAGSGQHDDYPDAIAEVIYQFDKNSPVYIGGYKEEEIKQPLSTKDKRGKHLAYPTAYEIAEHLNISKFNDNREEIEAREQEKDTEDPDDDQGGGFWFTM